jgi:hypothetical protein
MGLHRIRALGRVSRSTEGATAVQRSHSSSSAFGSASVQLSTAACDPTEEMPLP